MPATAFSTTSVLRPTLKVLLGLPMISNSVHGFVAFFFQVFVVKVLPKGKRGRWELG